MIVKHGYYILIPLSLIAIVNISEVIIEENDLLVRISVLTLFPIILVLYYHLVRNWARKYPVLEYDQTHIYNGEKAILLKNIVSIKMTGGLYVNGRNRFNLTYLTAEGDEMVIKFYPRLYYRNMKDLYQKIKAQNPSADLSKIFWGPFRISYSRH